MQKVKLPDSSEDAFGLGISHSFQMNHKLDMCPWLRALCLSNSNNKKRA